MNKSILLATVCALATGLIPLSSAMAEAPSSVAGTVAVGYGDFSGNGGGYSTYGANGAVVFGFTPDLGGQLNAGYISGNGSGDDAKNLSDWNIGGSLFWAPAFGRFGATVTYDSDSTDNTATTTTFGGFAEWYASDIITLAAKGGGFSSSNGGEGGGTKSGTYFGIGGTVYVVPDIAVGASVDYLSESAGSETVASIGGEWLISEQLPISVGASYTNISFSNGGNSTTDWGIDLKFYFNGDGSMSLRDRQRNGASGWAVEAPSLYGR